MGGGGEWGGGLAVIALGALRAWHEVLRWLLPPPVQVVVCRCVKWFGVAVCFAARALLFAVIV